MTSATLQFWIDDRGRVWSGPVCPDENMHYAIHQGRMTVPPYRWICSVRRSSPPDPAWSREISESDALAIIGPEYLPETV